MGILDKARFFLVSAAYEKTKGGVIFNTFVYVSEGTFPSEDQLIEECDERGISDFIGLTGITEVSREDAQQFEGK